MQDIAEQQHIEIKAKYSLLDINLAELWRYRDLMWLFVRRDFIAQYKQTLLGPVWHFIQPILTSLMFLLVFSRIAKIPTDGIDPIVFYMSGNVIWTYFSQCITSTSSTFTANANIFGKVYFPRLVLPLSVVISNMVRFGIQFLLLIVTMIYSNIAHGYPFPININWLFVPVIVILMAGLGLGAGIIISALTTKYRDFTVLITFAVQLMMYLTPIVYPLSFLKSQSYGKYVAWNPLTPIVEAFKYCVLGHGTVTSGGLIYSSVCVVVLLALGAVVFNKVEKTFMDTV